jgi:hypothetical protein
VKTPDTVLCTRLVWHMASFVARIASTDGSKRGKAMVLRGPSSA